MNVKFDSKSPIYIQIIELIKRDIVVGKLKNGDKLPSVREFSSMLKVNPNTLQRVYQELEREDITYTQRGMGTYVKGDYDMVAKLKKQMAKNVINNFVEGMKKLGFSEKEIIEIVKDKIKEGEK